MFLDHKDESFVSLNYVKKFKMKKKCIALIRSDHGGEFENGILHNFLRPRTPPKNGVVERKNRSLQEMTRTMLNDNYTLKHLWMKQ